MNAASPRERLALTDALALSLRFGAPLQGVLAQLRGEHRRLAAALAPAQSRLEAGEPPEEALAPLASVLGGPFGALLRHCRSTRELGERLTALADLRRAEATVDTELRRVAMWAAATAWTLAGAGWLVAQRLSPLSAGVQIAAWVAAALGGVVGLVAVVTVVAPRGRLRAAILEATGRAGLATARSLARVLGELRVLLEGGVPLPEALAAIEPRVPQPALRRSLCRVRQRLDAGVAVADAFAPEAELGRELRAWAGAAARVDAPEARLDELAGAMVEALRVRGRRTVLLLQAALLVTLAAATFALLGGAYGQLFDVTTVLPEVAR